MAETLEGEYGPRELSPVETIRHSTAHLMAAAIDVLYPGTKFGIGPHIDNGFYYDMDIPGGITAEDLPRIEEKMRELAKKNDKFVREMRPRAEALAWAEAKDQPFKKELIDGLDCELISFYTNGDFTDMCAGPHVAYTKKLKYFKLTHTAGAYWRGDEKRPMLTRIYGVAFETKEELDAHLALLEEAKKRDHRRIGKDLELFRITPEYGAGLCIWLPNGAFIRKQVEDLWRSEHLKRGYDFLFTPHTAPRSLWDTSGHAQHYADSMFKPIDVDGDQYFLKPMNCPFHIGAYNLRQRSYRELPLRYAELGTVYRYERSGALHGLMRVRGFTQDDAHIFCTEETLEQEIYACLDVAQFFYKTFGFEKYKVELSCRDPQDKEKYMGSDALWDLAENTLAKVLTEHGIQFKRIEGEAAFYGPKIDVKVVDAIGRTWQLTTVQMDWNLPERFDLTYIGADNQPHRPIMIHRAMLGSLERFFGILIEHYAGNFPTWLAPTQARLLPVSEKFRDYAESVAQKLRENGVRVQIDQSDEKLGYKIRKAEIDKLPYSLIIGQKEQDAGMVGVRKRMEGDLGAMTVEDFIARVNDEVTNRKL